MDAVLVAAHYRLFEARVLVPVKHGPDLVVLFE